VVRCLQVQPSRLWEDFALKGRRRSHRSYALLRRSSPVSVLLAAGLGLLAGVATAILLVASAALFPVPAPWLTVIASVASAVVAGTTTGAVLHRCKVAGQVAVPGAIFATSMILLLGGQVVGLAELSQYWHQVGLGAVIAADAWVAAVDRMTSVVSALDRAVPGLVAASAIAGREGWWIVAAGELALVLGVGLWVSRRALAAPFCVACRAWCVRQRRVAECAGHAAVPAVVRQRAAARDWRYFRELGPARGGSSLRFDLVHCPRCTRNNAVSVTWERPMGRNRRLVGDLRLGSDDLRTLRELALATPNPYAA